MLRAFLAAALILVTFPAWSLDREDGEPAIYIHLTEWSKLKNLAALGDPEAQFQLGWRYSQPDTKGLIHSYTRAAHWFRKAAYTGHAKAQYNLGVMYLKGLGVERDAVSAYAYFGLAAANGHAASGEVVAELTRRLPESVRAAARELQSDLVFRPH